MRLVLLYLLLWLVSSTWYDVDDRITQFRASFAKSPEWDGHPGDPLIHEIDIFKEKNGIIAVLWSDGCARCSTAASSNIRLTRKFRMRRGIPGCAQVVPWKSQVLRMRRPGTLRPRPSVVSILVTSSTYTMKVVLINLKTRSTIVNCSNTVWFQRSRFRKKIKMACLRGRSKNGLKNENRRFR